MKRIVTWLVFVGWLLPLAAGADQQPTEGTLLVATELVRGEVFAQTVILLLHYDENGAMGIVVNRPTEIEPEELLADVDAISGYNGAIYWGGPVQMNSLRALLRTDTPPKDAEAIVDSVYQVPIGDWLKDSPTDLASLRFFIGYAGWDAGQLDHEMDRGSWHVVPASNEHVFAEDPRALWSRLTPPREYRAATIIRLSGPTGTMATSGSCRIRCASAGRATGGSIGCLAGKGKHIAGNNVFTCAAEF